MDKFVLGIDFGEDSCIIAAANQRGDDGIKIIENEIKKRATSSMVAFGESTRILGDGAKSQASSNMENTITGFKRFIGQHHMDPALQEERKKNPFRTFGYKDGRVRIVVNYLKEERSFTPIQITAMLFTKLKNTAEEALGSEVTDVVIGVPGDFSIIRNKAISNAAKIAGLNVLSIITETNAAALTYGVFRRDLLKEHKGPVNVAFLDAGHSSLQVSVVQFDKNILRVLATTVDLRLGGQGITLQLAATFQNHFKNCFNVDAKGSARATMRVLKEAEKAKRKMSETSVDIPISIDNLVGNRDVSLKIKRSDMESMIASDLGKFKETMEKCLSNSRLKSKDIFAVIAVGGSSYIPKVQNIIKQVFGKTPSSIMNQDEVVARGCALHCSSNHGFQIEDQVDAEVIRRNPTCYSTPDLPALTANEMNGMEREEATMVKADKEEKYRLEAKNDLEGYIINLKNSLQAAGNKGPYCNDLIKALNKAENLLFVNGKYCQKHEYIKIQNEFKKHGEQIKINDRQQIDTSKSRYRDDEEPMDISYASPYGNQHGMDMSYASAYGNPHAMNEEQQAHWDSTQQIREQQAELERKKRIMEDERIARELEYMENQRQREEQVRMLQEKLRLEREEVEKEKKKTWWQRIF